MNTKIANEAKGYLFELEMGDFQSKNSKFKTVRELAQGKEKTIVAYGTSLTDQTGWVYIMQKIFDFKYPGKARFINSALGGMDSNWGKANLEERVLKHNPDMVIIEFAINDAFVERNIDPELCRSNLIYMIETIKAKNPECEVVIMTMNMPVLEHFVCRPNIKEYYEVYRNAAKERNIPLVDNLVWWEELLSKGIDEYKKLVPDGIHPSVYGHEKGTVPNLMKVLY